MSLPPKQQLIPRLLMRQLLTLLPQKLRLLMTRLQLPQLRLMPHRLPRQLLLQMLLMLRLLSRLMMWQKFDLLVLHEGPMPPALLL